MKSESGNNPWEFNLRDILRWCSLMCKHQVITLVIVMVCMGLFKLLYYKSNQFVMCKYVYSSCILCGFITCSDHSFRNARPASAS